jgi:hypothetical protein
MGAAGHVRSGVGDAREIVLGCADGKENKQIAEQLRVHPDTVSRWRQRFLRLRLDGLIDEARPGRPPSISLDQVERVVVATLEETPAGATHWTRASMAWRSGALRLDQDRRRDPRIPRQIMPPNFRRMTLGVV